LTEIKTLPADRWKEYRRLRLEALELSPLAFGTALQEGASSGEMTWKKHLGQVSFAMKNDEPVGMITCVFTEGVKFEHIAEIHGFYVRPNYRGRGIGRELLEHAIAKARTNPRILKVRLYVNSRQLTAVNLYRRAGFAVVGRLAREMKVGQRLYTMLVMEKTVRRS